MTTRLLRYDNRHPAIRPGEDLAVEQIRGHRIIDRNPAFRYFNRHQILFQLRHFAAYLVQRPLLMQKAC